MFRWASISKTLTAVTSIKAALNGQIDLDRAISDYYLTYSTPDSWIKWSAVQNQSPYDLIKISPSVPITMRMLLGHMSGVQHYGNGLANVEPPEIFANDPRFNTGFEWPLSYWISSPLVSVPGEFHNYTTVGYNLAGVVLEKATGQPFFNMVKNAVAIPYKMTTLQPDYQWVPILNRAAGYVKSEATGAVEPDTNNDVSWKLPGGGFISTTRDMARYCQGMMNEKTGLTSQERNLLWTSLKDAAGKLTEYGLGFQVKTIDGHVKIYHSGLQEKARTLMIMYPEENLCLVAMSNSQFAEPKEILASIETVLRSRAHGP
jgi:CubicO group peptidase (beta-lactamase class C family)